MLRAALLFLALTALAAGETRQTNDRTVRYVNDQVITQGDLLLRNGERVEEYRRSGRVLPESRAEQIAFFRESLEQLTDEELLVQQARERGIQIDNDRLMQEVLEQAKRSGMGIRQIADQRRRLEREEQIRTISEFFQARAATVSPAELSATYQEGRATWRRPPRVRLLHLVLRASPPEEQANWIRAAARWYKQAQQVEDAPLKALAESRLDAYLAADAAGQAAILAELLAAFAARQGDAGLDRNGAAVVAAASDLKARRERSRDRDEVAAEMERLRAEIAIAPDPATRAAAFRDRARAAGGPHAEDGGALGWVEPGTYAAAFDEAAFALPAGGLSPVFWTDQSANLLLVEEREEGRNQSFDEVSGTLQTALDRGRRKQARVRAATYLRAQASIVDLTPIEALVP